MAAGPVEPTIGFFLDAIRDAASQKVWSKSFRWIRPKGLSIERTQLDDAHRANALDLCLDLRIGLHQRFRLRADALLAAIR